MSVNKLYLFEEKKNKMKEMQCEKQSETER